MATSFQDALKLLLDIADENAMKGAGPIDEVDEIAEDYVLATGLIQKIHNEEVMIDTCFSKLKERYNRRSATSNA